MSTYLKQLVILLFVAVLGAGCITKPPSVEAPKDVIHFPISVAVHPSGRYAAVSNANFDRAYKNGFVSIIDLATYKIVADWTMPVGSFAGQVIFNHAGTRLYVTARGEFNAQDGLPDEPADTLVSVDVDLTAAKEAPGTRPFFVAGTRQTLHLAPDPYGLAIDADDHFLYVTHLSNGEVSVLEEQVGVFTDSDEAAAEADSEVQRRCLPEHLVFSEAAAGSLGGACTANADCGTTKVAVPADGSATAGDAGDTVLERANSCLTDPRASGRSHCATYCEVDRTVKDGSGAVLRVGCPEGYLCMGVRPFRVVNERRFSSGANQAAISPATGSVYITHRDADVLGVLRPYHVDTATFAARLEQFTVGDGSDLRGLAFDPAGDRLYVATRNTTSSSSSSSTSYPAVLVFDTSLTYEGCLDNEVVGDTLACEANVEVGTIEVDDEPSGVAWRDGMLYVLLYGADSLWAIDTTSRDVIDRVDLSPEAFVQKPGIFSSHARPYALDLYRNDEGLWAAVASFAAHEVAIVHLRDAQGNSINRVTRKIENRAKLYETVYY